MALNIKYLRLYPEHHQKHFLPLKVGHVQLERMLNSWFKEGSASYWADPKMLRRFVFQNSQLSLLGPLSHFEMI